MNSEEILRLVDQIQRERKIDRETVFVSIEQALIIAARKRGEPGEESVIDVHIDRRTGEINACRDNIPIPPAEITERIGAQTAKQVIIQKIRAAESDIVYDEFKPLIGTLVTGVVTRDDSVTLVNVHGYEALLPASDKILNQPINQRNGRNGRDSRDRSYVSRERFRVGESVVALVAEVEKHDAVTKVKLSRTRPLMVQRLFEQEIPEIYDGVIEIKGVSRQPGKRSKVAVASSDPRIDLVGACVGIRSSRINAIISQINGERVDVVPWSSDPIEFIQNALRPAEVAEVILCSELGRAIVLAPENKDAIDERDRDKNVKLAKGNAKLASRLCGWDVDVMTYDDLNALIARANDEFSKIEGLDSELVDKLVGQGFVSYDDLSIIETDYLMQLGDLTFEQAEAISNRAEELAEEQEEEAKRAKESRDRDSRGSWGDRRRFNSERADGNF